MLCSARSYRVSNITEIASSPGMRTVPKESASQESVKKSTPAQTRMRVELAPTLIRSHTVHATRRQLALINSLEILYKVDESAREYLGVCDQMRKGLPCTLMGYYRRLILSLLRVINLKFALQPYQKCNITQLEEHGFS